MKHTHNTDRNVANKENTHTHTHTHTHTTPPFLWEKSEPPPPFLEHFGKSNPFLCKRAGWVAGFNYALAFPS